MRLQVALGTQTHPLLRDPTTAFRPSVCLNSFAFVLVALAKEHRLGDFPVPEKLRRSLQIEGGLPLARAGR